MSLKSYYQFFLTICKHKWVVFQECRACGITWQGITHDLSKFGPTEFFSSARYFEGDKSPHYGDAAENGYSLAWLHHKGCNKHHWEFWTDFNEEDGSIKVNKIPYQYVVEMVCDWVGAGKVYEKDVWTQNSPLEYYNKVRSGRHFHPETEKLVMKFLYAISDYGLDTFHKMAKNVFIRLDYEGVHVI